MKQLFLMATLSLLAKPELPAQNLGFGTTTPAYPITVETNNYKGIAQLNGSVAIGFYTSSSTAFLQTWSNHYLQFSTNNAPAQLTLNTSGYLGVGTAFPGRLLDVDGTVRLRIGSPAAGSVLNTDANGNASWKAVPVKTVQTLFIPFSAFVGSFDYMNHENVNNQSRRSTGFLNEYYRYQAPLLLPVGTVIKEIKWQYFDNNLDLDLSFDLVREYFQNNSVVSHTTSNGALNADWYRTVTPNHTLENYFYWLDIYCFSWSPDASLRFKGATITYE